MINQLTFLAATLGLPNSWKIDEAHLVVDQSTLQIRVRPAPESSFTCPCCGAKAAINSETEEEWHHPDFINASTILHAHVPYIFCPDGCGLQRVTPPWQHPHSRFSRTK